MGGGGGGSPSKTMQVEVLLRAFSSSLQAHLPRSRRSRRFMIAISAIISQAQIRHRSYFYKTSVLVREGILVLHGDELGADLTQASHFIGDE